MRNSDRLTIAVFGEGGTLTAEINSSWAENAIDLLGPYSATDAVSQHWCFASALIDVRYSPEVMLPLMGELDARAIPYVFFVPIHVVESEPGPFVLSAAPKDISRTLTALSDQGCRTKH